MAGDRKKINQPSLAQLFDAPKGYVGRFGWLCGYAADALFLDDAIERFTRLTNSQRAHQGRISLAAFLDPGNPPVSLLDAPGVAHLPIIDVANKPFRLLHAKVALLGFRNQVNHSQWQLRLLVSTGNWTRQTLEESLDLIWRIDISNESLNDLTAGIKQDCADIKAAWNLMEWVQERFDTRLLDSTHGRLSETMNTLQKVRQWIDACSKKAQGSPRIFDNRSKSLLSQLPRKIKACGEVKRNYLAMGSGFYEAPEEQGSAPKVAVAIVESLGKEGLLTTKPEVDIYVNPMACQAVATSLQPLHDRGITVRPAAIPPCVFGEGAQRSLHAKFLFSANYRGNSNACNSAWIYLGSGNLTHPGFANKMDTSKGNLEAGVVFAPNSLCWQKNKTSPEHQVVTNLLPIQWDEKVDVATPPSAGSGMEQRDAIYVKPPVAWLEWHKADGVCELRIGDDSNANVDVLDSAGNACRKTQSGFEWGEEAQPRQVCIRWQANGQTCDSLIPVVDQYGRIAATELPSIDIDEAWWQLADFPLASYDDSGEDRDGGADESEDKVNKKGRSEPIASYPIRQMMELLESIAAKQTEIDEIDWALWCNRLEQTLGQAGDSVPVKYFRDELKLNPLSPLYHHSFRPSFAENNDSEPGKLYDETLGRIEVNWKVNDNELSLIGGAK